MIRYRYIVHGFVAFLIVLLSSLSQQIIAQILTDQHPVLQNGKAIPSTVFAADNTVKFTENRGQFIDTKGNARPDILYKVESKGMAVFFFKSRISYVFVKTEGNPEAHHHDGDEAEDKGLLEMYRTDLELIGANSNVRVEPQLKAESYNNYYLAHCSDGITRVPQYQRLVYREVYPNIDMVIDGAKGGVKCDFVVRPGGKVSDIRMRYVAANNVRLGASGQLHAETPLGSIEEQTPFSFQTISSGQQTVESRFTLKDGIVGFAVGAYDHSRELVIDPYRKWSTYFGGSSGEQMLGGDPTEVDRTGNVLLTALTTSTNFPVSTGAYQTTYAANTDAVVARFNPAGSRLWATYYGGNSDDIPHGIVTDLNLNVFIAGHTSSTNFPVTSGAYQTSYGGGTRDAIAVKFDSNGTRQWGTYIGGNNFDDGYGFAADSNGAVAVFVTTGTAGLGTSGTFQPTKPTGAGNNTNNYDILIVKLSASGTRLWATYYGGNNVEFGYAGASDARGNILLTGWTYSSDFPTTTGAYQTTYGGSGDAFVVKLNGSGNRVWGSYYGGSSTENDDTNPTGYSGMAVDGNNNVYISGCTKGNFPTSTGAFQTTFGGGAWDGFAVKFDSNGTRQWATYIGGSGSDYGVGIASNTVGGVLATGFTASTNFPVTTDAYQATNAGNNDAFILKLNASGARVYSTYYGGTNDDRGEGISFDPFGSVYMAGQTASTDFPTLSPYQANNAGSTDAFIVLFCDIDGGVVDTSGPKTFCQGDSVILSVRRGYASVRWSNGATSDSITVKTDGSYWVRLTNGAGCEATTDTIHVRVNPRPNPSIAGQLAICQGDSTILDAGTGYSSYLWSTGARTRTIVVKQAGTFYVRVTNSFGCSDSSRPVTVVVNPRPDPVSILPKGPHTFCDGESVTLIANPVAGSYLWNSGERTQSIIVTRAGKYFVTVTNSFGCIVRSDTIQVFIDPKPSPQILPYAPPIICEGDSLILGSTPGFKSYLWSTGDTAQQITVRQPGTYSLTVTDAKGCIGSSSLQVQVVTPPKPKVIVIGSNPFCAGDSVILDAGSGFKSYEWSTGEVSQRIIVRKAGSFSVFVRDPVGCSGNSDTVTITVNPRPSTNLNGPTQVCANSIASYTVPADPLVSYTWSVTGGGGSIISGAGTNTISVQWGASGTGKVSITVKATATGCTSTAELTVAIGTSLVPSVTANRTIKPNGTITLCVGDQVTLDAGSYASYTWSTGETTKTITVTTAGTYTVMVVDAGGCSGESKPINVEFSTPPTPTISAAKTSICPGDSVVLDAGNYTSYEWSGGQITRTITVRQPGDYSVTVTDVNGCTGTSTPFTIRQETPPSPVIDGKNSVCLNSTAVYSVSGTAGNVYVWRVSGGSGSIISGQGTSSITVQWTVTGSELVQVEETSFQTGCRGESQPYPVAIGSSLTPQIVTSGSTALCEGDSVQLSIPSGYATYQWSTGATTRSIYASTAGQYRVTVTDDGGCSGSDSINVVLKQLPQPFISPTGTVGLCPGDSVELSAAGGYLSYLWSNGETTRAIMVRSAGAYSVMATNEDGCRGSSEVVTVIEHPAPMEPTIARSIDTLISTPAVSYQWNFDGVAIPGATQQRHVATSLGAYTVTITDANGCRSTSKPADQIEASATVEIADYEAEPGQTLKIPLTLTASRNLDNIGAFTYTATLRFYRNILFPLAPTELGQTDGPYRVVTVTGQRAAGVTEGPIGEITMTAALGDTLTSPVFIDSFEWESAVVGMSFRRGSVTVSPKGGWKLYLPDGKLTLLPVRPNPTLGPTDVVYETIEVGRTQLYVVDMVGRRAVTIQDAELIPGKYTASFNSAILASGAYFVVLQTPTGRLVQPFQVEH